VKVMLLSEAELRSCVGFDREALAAVEHGFSRLAEGRAFAPPVIAIEIPEHHGEVDIKTAYVEGLESFAVKVASGFADNPARGLPYGTGMMVLISAETGFLQALLVDNGYLTELRTGLAGAAAADRLATACIDRVGVIGSGSQARYQLRGLRMVRDFSRVSVYGIVAADVARYADEIEAELDVEVVVAATPEGVVRESDVVVCTTPSHTPYLEARWLHPGLHVTCMGSDMPAKQELHADCFARADLVVCDRLSQCRAIGELHHALDAGEIDEHEIVELGQVTAGRRPGRTRDDEITICDLTGVGVQDTAIAHLTFRRALERGLGTSFGAGPGATGTTPTPTTPAPTTPAPTSTKE
jgi:ectoine utilization protein EutC